jgi:integrase
VVQSLEQTKAGLRFKTPKTKRSRRTIALSPSLVEELQAHRVKQAAARFAWGMGKAALVFTTIVSERLGHASIAISMDTYSHAIPGLQQDAAQRIDGALRDAITGSLGWQSGGKRADSA